MTQHEELFAVIDNSEKVEKYTQIMENFFEYLETSTQQERQEIGENIKKLYFGAYKDLQETFAEHRQNRKSTRTRQNYFESVQRFGAICDVLDLLGIDTTELQDNFYKEYNGTI